MLRRCLCLLGLAAFLAVAADVKVTPAEQEEEARWLKSLGVQMPVTPWPPDDPFAQPFTRRSLVVPTAWYRNRPKTLQADLFREDVRLLRKIMETAYAGWETAQRRGWDWDKFFQEWDEALAARGTDALSLTDAFAPWRKFMDVQLDNHSGPSNVGLRPVGHAGSWIAVLAQAPAAGCSEFRTAKGATYRIDSSDKAQQLKRREDRLGKPLTYLAAPFTRGPITAVHCGEQWIPAEPAWFVDEGDERGANIRALAQTEKDVPTFRSISPRIGYVRFPSFSKPAVELTIAMEKTLQSRTHNEEVLIVDLRGNDGGDVRIQALAGWTKFLPSGSQTRLGHSCLYPPLRWGYMQSSGGNLKLPVSDTMRAGFQRFLNDLFHDDAPGCPAVFSETPAKWNYIEHRYPSKPVGKTRLLAVVDNFCGSDCEGAVQAIAAQPGNVIAGVNTFGVAQYIQPGYFVLPHTRLPFRLALGTSDHYGDGRTFDGYGFDVDVVLASKKDQSPESIIQLAERLLP